MDDADTTGIRMEKEEAARQAAIREAVRGIPAGRAGECELCGEWSGRLVLSTCPPCRDKYKLA